MRGEMSIFGPRPHMLVHDDYFQAQIADYSRRQRVRPGITGWAQVNGCRGSVNSLGDVKRRLMFDLEYIDDYRFRMDAVIAWRTLGIVLSGRESWFRWRARPDDHAQFGTPRPGLVRTQR